LNSNFSPVLEYSFKSSFQSTCACNPSNVSNLGCPFIDFSGFISFLFTYLLKLEYVPIQNLREGSHFYLQLFLHFYFTIYILSVMRTLQPNTAVQVSVKNLERFIIKALEIVGPGFGEPPFFNFDGVLLKMLRQGKSLEDARTA